MRKSLAVALICTAAFVPWWMHKPDPPAIPPEQQNARLLTVFDWDHDAAWFGGLSGLETSDDGRRFYAVSDRGHLLRGTLMRDEDRLTGVVITEDMALRDDKGEIREFPHTDAEGLALDGEERLFVSFEHAHRILRYDTWGANAIWPSYTRSWRALGRNLGLEMVAVDAAGTLYTIPEGVPKGASESLVYRRLPDSKWEQPFTLPLEGDFVPVGGDFGPDGRFYLLERDAYPFAFRSRVRSMAVKDSGFDAIRTEMETALGTYGNLEGLAVWRDGDGRIRLLMVSDDNFLPFLPSQLVEYVLTE
jgi:hypothetical protein